MRFSGNFWLVFLSRNNVNLLRQSFPGLYQPLGFSNVNVCKLFFSNCHCIWNHFFLFGGASFSVRQFFKISRLWSVFYLRLKNTSELIKHTLFFSTSWAILSLRFDYKIQRSGFFFLSIFCFTKSKSRLLLSLFTSGALSAQLRSPGALKTERNLSQSWQCL